MRTRFPGSWSLTRRGARPLAVVHDYGLHLATDGTATLKGRTVRRVGSASNFSTDQRRAKLFVDRVDAEAVAYQLRRMYPRLTQDIEVTPVQPTALVYSSNGRNRVAIV